MGQPQAFKVDLGLRLLCFSFTRLDGADPVLGVEMASTGEVGCIAPTFDEALLLSLFSTHHRLPKKGILLSAGTVEQKQRFLPCLNVLKRLQVPIYATSGTARFLEEHGVQTHWASWPGESGSATSALELIYSGQVDWVINVPKNFRRAELSNGSQVRQAAIRRGCVLLTQIDKAIAFIDALGRYPQMAQSHQVKPLPPART